MWENAGREKVREPCNRDAGCSVGEGSQSGQLLGGGDI